MDQIRENSEKLESFKCVDISTAHITENDNRLFLDIDSIAYNDMICYETGYGYVIHLSDDRTDESILNDMGLSKAFLNVYKTALLSGARYMMLDCDAPEYDFFEKFDW